MPATPNKTAPVKRARNAKASSLLPRFGGSNPSVMQSVQGGIKVLRTPPFICGNVTSATGPRYGATTHTPSRRAGNERAFLPCQLAPIAGLLSVVGAFSAHAGGYCDTEHSIETRLIMQEGETEKRFLGTVKRGAVFIWSNPKTGSWTITVHPPTGGMVCMQMAGQSYQGG